MAEFIPSSTSLICRHGAEQYRGDLELIFSGYHLDRTVPKIPEPVYCLMPSLLICWFSDALYYLYHCAASYSIIFSKPERWPQVSTVCTRADSAPIHIPSSKICSSQQYARMYFIIVPCQCTPQGNAIKSWLLKISEIQWLAALRSTFYSYQTLEPSSITKSYTAIGPRV